MIEINKKSIPIIVGLVAILCLSTFYAGLSLQIQNNLSHRDPQVSANVFVLKDGVVVYESGNTITDIGEAWLRSWVGMSGAANTTARSAAMYISVSNDASPLASWTKLPNEITANGFTRTIADSVVAWENSGDSAYNATITFTATGTQQIQCAGLNWDATSDSDNNLFACAAINQATYSVTEGTGDTLTIKWVITFNAN